MIQGTLQQLEGRLCRSVTKASKVAIARVVGARKAEKILIVSNPDAHVCPIAESLYVQALEVGAEATLVIQPIRSQFDYANEAVVAAVASKPDICLSISKRKMGKDRKALANPYTGEDGRTYDSTYEYLRSGVKQMRGFWTPGITLDMWSRTVDIDYDQLAERCRRLKKALTGAKEVRINSSKGTDVVISIEGMAPMADDGDFRSPGRGGNLPAGEVFISPKAGTTNGRVVFDGSFAIEDTVVLKDPIEVTIENGFVTEVEGKQEAKQLLKRISDAERQPLEMAERGDFKPEVAKKYARNARSIGELGIGLNPKARIVGLMLEDEKVLGTIHLAIGSDYDRVNPALIHLDGLVMQPTVEVDGKVIMEDGELKG